MVELVDRSFTSVAALQSALANLGAEQAFVKMLANNQDNEKNQIYLGPTDALLSTLPGETSFATGSTSTLKRRSIAGQGKTVLNLRFSWLFPDGSLSPAPAAKIIYYFQYPEIRFSGFLAGAERSPRPLRRDYQDRYGRRVLVLAVRGLEVIGTVITDADGPRLVDELGGLPLLAGQSLLRVLDLPQSLASPNLQNLLTEVSDIAGRWHIAQRLRAGATQPEVHQAQQGSGWTLEALLGIPMNARKGPDKYGYEIKALGGSSPLSVITSEPDGGVRAEEGLGEFLRRFGWAGAQNDGSLRFNGKHDTLREFHKSSARMFIDHWDPITNAPDGTGEPTVMLIHSPSQTVLAQWNYTSLASKWASKHNGCVYVAYQRWPAASGLATHYIYGKTAYCGLGTSVNHLLRALSSGVVYTDPGDRMYATGETKNRMQWRISGTKKQPLPTKLRSLYVEWREIEIVQSAIETQFSEICALGP